MPRHSQGDESDRFILESKLIFLLYQLIFTIGLKNPTLCMLCLSHTASNASVHAELVGASL